MKVSNTSYTLGAKQDDTTLISFSAVENLGKKYSEVGGIKSVCPVPFPVL